MHYGSFFPVIFAYVFKDLRFSPCLHAGVKTFMDRSRFLPCCPHLALQQSKQTCLALNLIEDRLKLACRVRWCTQGQQDEMQGAINTFDIHHQLSVLLSCFLFPSLLAFRFKIRWNFNDPHVEIGSMEPQTATRHSEETENTRGLINICQQCVKHWCMFGGSTECGWSVEGKGYRQSSIF